jgi:hypothetical protein
MLTEKERIMGWTYMNKPRCVSEWFADSLTWETEKTKNTCLKTAINFKEAYAAVETIDKATGERRVWAAAFMLNYTRDAYYNFGYKDMDESMGPGICNCPASVLDLLTPTDREHAIKWRAACRKRADRKPIRIGDTIEFNQPLSCGDTVFTKIKYGRKRNIFKSSQGIYIRLPQWVFNAYEYKHI